MVSAISLERARTMLERWLTAEEALATSQEYSISVDGSSRTLRRADLSEVAKRIAYWAGKVQQLERASQCGRRSRYLVN